MSTSQPSSDSRSEDPGSGWLSALADGRADALAPGCRAFDESEEARATWHRYQLIGDVLRSAELAPQRRDAAAHDAEFLHRLRQRLAAEPAVLAPAPLAAPQAASIADSRRRVALTASGRQRWLVPVAAAAGVAVVAALVVLGGVGLPGQAPRAPVLASSDPAAGTMLRSAELDEYLRAHRLQRGAVVPIMPGGGLQQTELTAEPREVPRTSTAPGADGRR